MKLVNILTYFSSLTQKAQLFLVGALLLVAFTVGNCRGEDKLDKFIGEYESFKKEASATVEYADSLKREVAQLTDKARKKDVIIQNLNTTIVNKETQRKQQQTKLVSLESRLVSAKNENIPEIVIATQDTIIGNLKTQLVTTDEIITNQKRVITVKDEQISLLNSALYTSNARGDSLQLILGKLPPTPKNPNKVFGIPLPNRKTTFVVGLATGLATGIAIMR